MDPAAAIAAICREEGLWLHVDAAYGGAMALVPEYRPLLAGWEEADSIVVNPHKWMFTPIDASLLLFRGPERFRDVFSLVPEYLRTPDAPGVRNYNEYGIQLGRRFRALKMWMLIRWFGADGLASRIREHVRLARRFADRIEADPDWELLAPVPMATVCFRHHPRALDGREAELDRRNEAILERVNEILLYRGGNRKEPEMKLSDFDYRLPSGLIAQHPPAKRGDSRLMVLNRGRASWEHRSFSHLPEYLKPGDALVVNDTQVIPARLIG